MKNDVNVAWKVLSKIFLVAVLIKKETRYFEELRWTPFLKDYWGFSGLRSLEPKNGVLAENCNCYKN